MFEESKRRVETNRATLPKQISGSKSAALNGKIFKNYQRQHSLYKIKLVDNPTVAPSKDEELASPKASPEEIAAASQSAGPSSPRS